MITDKLIGNFSSLKWAAGQLVSTGGQGGSSGLILEDQGWWLDEEGVCAEWKAKA